MMKRLSFLIIFLIAISAIAGYLMSRGTWVGRIGMHIFHREYLFLNTWWKGSLMVFGALIIILILHAIIQKTLPNIVAKLIHVILLMAALTGLYYNYYDFRTDFEHHLMGERFHLGFYLFWIGWVGIALFYISKKKKLLVTIADKTIAAGQ
jgi:hypothetical protein